MTLIGYKIRNRQGLFSKGGYWPTWDSKGKLWTTKSGITNHIHAVGVSGQYGNAEIVEIYAEVKPIGTVKDWDLSAALKREAREQRRQEAARRAIDEKRYKEYLALKAEFEK